MSKKSIAIIIIGVIVAVGILGGVLFARSKQTVLSPVTVQEENELQASVEPSSTQKEYVDAAGFQFSYPDDLTISPKKNLDEITYAQVQITSTVVSGSILIRAAETKVGTLTEWTKQNEKLAKAEESTRETILAGLDAVEIITNDSIVLAAIDQGVLFTIEVFPQKVPAYWQKVYESILSTFAFAASESSTPGKVTAGEESSDVVFEGEEAVE